jgi:hypothetical protein
VPRWQEGQAAAGGAPERAHRVTVSDAVCQSTRAAPMLRRPFAHGPMGEDQEEFVREERHMLRISF